MQGAFSFADDDRTVTLHPDKPFSHGETVMVVLSHDIRGADGSPLRDEGCSWTFWTNARPAVMNFVEVGRMTTRTNQNETSRSYGGLACDANGDGFLDMTIVNEDTADLRVFLNKGDRSGTFHPFLQPTFPCGNRASPNETGDFNRDGLPDVCVAAINDDTVSVLLGNGDGAFRPRQVINVGSTPRGIAVLDADGDGDLDIANTNAGGAGSVSITLNDGTGVFGAPSFFEGGGTNEWSLGAADMNEDLILDLVIGARGSQLMNVMTGNGDGTFTAASSRACDGRTWMLALGDVNGDRHFDVATANSSENRSAIMPGDGLGGLGAAVRYTTDAFPLATDFGDLDGDGDLDWINSGYAGDWWVHTNNGAGVFTFFREFDAPRAASCSVPFDMDNDGDLDLALIDEEEDVVIFMKNSGTSPFPGDGNADCRIDLADWAAMSDCLAAPGACASPGCLIYDMDDDCDVDLADAGKFANAFTGEDEIPTCNP
ncbi:MAG: VCBS repeat-containing protein [Phycisphaerales bacterium]|nr:VCBS repeat-containing protein [Phycisphaerales bacterium]